MSINIIVKDIAAVFDVEEESDNASEQVEAALNHYMQSFMTTETITPNTEFITNVSNILKEHVNLLMLALSYNSITTPINAITEIQVHTPKAFRTTNTSKFN